MSITPSDHPGLIVADCNSCAAEKMEEQGGWNGGSFIGHPSMYSKCGNKRCPCAAHHDNACTGSNETGQTGSLYP